jgi:hypothetical protein
MTFKEEKQVKNAILFGIYLNELHNTDMNDGDYVSWIETRLCHFNDKYERMYPYIDVKNPKRKITIKSRLSRMAKNELPYQNNDRVKIHLNSIIKLNSKHIQYIASKLKY